LYVAYAIQSGYIVDRASRTASECECTRVLRPLGRVFPNSPFKR
jgi:hypothetical protein